MKKMMLSVTAFLLSANLSNTKAQDIEKLSIVPTSQLESEASQQSTQQFEFQRWVRNANFIGKKWVGEDSLLNISEKEVTTKQIKNTLPPNLKSYNIRIIFPNSVVTMEFNTKRINISVNNENKIMKVYLG